MKDPLDQKIDQLLASQPVEARPDFAARTLAKAEAQTQQNKPGGLAPLIRFALPLAAAIALAFIIIDQFGSDGPAAPVQISESSADNNAALTSYEIEELLLLQEGLTGFAQVEVVEFSSGDDLLDTLQTLNSI
jgi:hypothetical protein